LLRFAAIWRIHQQKQWLRTTLVHFYLLWGRGRRRYQSIVLGR